MNTDKKRTSLLYLCSSVAKLFFWPSEDRLPRPQLTPPWPPPPPCSPVLTLTFVFLRGSVVNIILLAPHRPPVASVNHFDSNPAGITISGLFVGNRNVPTPQYQIPVSRRSKFAFNFSASSLSGSLRTTKGEIALFTSTRLNASTMRK